jgi:ATP-dependent helicase HepA
MSFVTSKENTLGIGKLIERNEDFAVVEYFDSPVSVEREQVLVSPDSLASVTLTPQTRVYFLDRATGVWRVGRINGHVDGVCYIALPNHGQVALRDPEVFTRWNRAIEKPCDHLAARVTETPFFHSARTALMKNFIRQRAASAGITALLSSPIELECHQIEVIRTVLQDPVQRYLLADEVGLGKTIEAGVIIRQHILDRPRTHSVLIVTPPGLVEQWRQELAQRCSVNAAKYGHRVEVIALEALVDWRGEPPDFLVVDEAHQAVHGWQEGAKSLKGTRFEKLRLLSNPVRCPKLLLLSATPVRNNEEGFLALLHLLDPAMYSLADVAGFRLRVAKRQELSNLLEAFTEDQATVFVDGMIDQLAELFPDDRRLAKMLGGVRHLVNADAAPGDNALPIAIRAVRLHLSETYRLHRRFLRNRRTEKLAGLLPGRDKLQTFDAWKDGGIRQAEELLESWRSQASAVIWLNDDEALSAGLSQVFRILLESAWGDFAAFAVCLEARLAGVVPTKVGNYGLLTEVGRLRILASIPHFAGEEEILRELTTKRTALRRWQQERIEAWGKQIENLRLRNLRIVCIATSPETADQLFERLRVRFATEAVRHHLDAALWLQAWVQGTAKILVCDASAEEGLNLQGPKTCLVNIDLPLSPNRLEQRMGRLDRFGVGNPVVSYAFQVHDAPYWSAWLRCLADGWQVFGRSIAALQYTVEDVMRELTGRMFLEGSSAITTATESLGGEKGVLATELRAISNQDALDALDNEARLEGAEAWLSRLEACDSESDMFQRATENWLLEGMKFLRAGLQSSIDPVARYHYRESDYGKQTLISTYEIARWFAGAFERGAKHPEFKLPLTHAIAFSRITARSRGVGLARLGNAVINCVHDYLRWDDRGVSFAMWRPSVSAAAGGVPRAFFRFDFIVETDMAALDSCLRLHPALIANAAKRQADGAFPPFMETVWVDQELAVPEPALLTELSRPFDKNRDANVNQERWPRALAIFGPVKWGELCADAQRAGEVILRERRNVSRLTRECSEAFETAVVLAREQGESRLEALAEQAAAHALLQAELNAAAHVANAIAEGIRVPRVRLDSAGVIFLATKPLPPP